MQEQQVCSVVEHVHRLLKASEEAGESLEKWLCGFAPEIKKYWSAPRRFTLPLWANSVVILAAAFNKNSALRSLLEAGGNKNAEDENYKTALMLAAQGGSVEAVKVLINAKAKIDCKDKDGQTALMLAAINGHVETMKALIEASADKEAKNDSE